MEEGTPVFAEHSYGDTFNLNCPLCGWNYIHQMSTITEFRKGEDKEATRTTVNGYGDITTTVTTDIAGRRDNVYIGFQCENCSDEWSRTREDNPPQFTLHIQQHKGQTLISWIK